MGLFTYNVSDVCYPLLASKSRTLFKLFLCDTGLLSFKLLGTNAIKVLNGNTTINYGAIYENVVAKELSSHGFKLFYSNDKKRGEVDFLIEYDSKVIPVEVKSGKDYKRHSALDNLLSDKNKEIEKAYVFSNGNVEVKGKRIYLPIYMVTFLSTENEAEDTIFKVDISAL
ncbi:MAG: DUF4143 domain-containing protein [Clostridia bacterium]|nr:DUF4143 domain-containing protein [Clostridia bacterium]